MQSPPTGVVLVQGSQAPGTAVAAFMSRASLSLEQLSFACASELSASPAQYQAALAISSAQTHFSSQTLSSLARSLAPGATLHVYVQDASQSQLLQKELLLAGFLDIQPVDAAPGVAMVQAKKPTWEVGAKAALSLKRPAPVPAPAAAPVTAAQAWKLSMADEDEMVDEDELLAEEDKSSLPAITADAGDCSTSRKACKDCSCGRAEAEAAGEKVQLTQEMLDNPQTNCGSCALGDAFRCAGCPYRGLPAFEPGKKITLGSDFLTADA